MSSSEWLGGKEAIPPKISMASLFDGEGLKEVSGVEEKPTGAINSPAPKAAEPSKPVETTKKTPEPAAPKATPEPVPEPVSIGRPAPSMKEQGASMAAMVNKFADGEEDGNVSDDDNSSFEEVPKPVERAARSPVAEASSPRVSSPLRPKEVETNPQPAATVRLLRTSTPYCVTLTISDLYPIFSGPQELHTRKCRS
jgi:coronin-1B/1C/6